MRRAAEELGLPPSGLRSEVDHGEDDEYETGNQEEGHHLWEVLSRRAHCLVGGVFDLTLNMDVGSDLFGMRVEGALEEGLGGVGTLLLYLP